MCPKWTISAWLLGSGFYNWYQSQLVTRCVDGYVNDIISFGSISNDPHEDARSSRDKCIISHIVNEWVLRLVYKLWALLNKQMCSGLQSLITKLWRIVCPKRTISTCLSSLSHWTHFGFFIQMFSYIITYLHIISIMYEFIYIDP